MSDSEILIIDYANCGILLVGGGLTLLLSGILFSLLLIYPDLRKHPGDLIQGIAISTVMISIMWFSWSSIRLIDPQHTDHSISPIFGQISVALFSLLLCYLVFFLFTSWMSIKYAVKKPWMPTGPAAHILVLMMTAGFTYLIIHNHQEFYFFNYYSRDPKDGHRIFIVPFFILLAMVIITLILRRDTISRLPDLKKLIYNSKQDFFDFYPTFMLVSVFLQGSIICTNILKESFLDVPAVFDIVIFFESVMQLVSIFSLIYLFITRDPKIQRKLGDSSVQIPFLVDSAASKRLASARPSRRPTRDEGMDMIKVSTGLQSALIQNSALLINEVNLALKQSQVFSALYALRYCMMKNSKQPIQYELNEGVLLTDPASERDRENLARCRGRVEFLDLTINQFAPGIFAEILKMDSDYLDIDGALDLFSNQDQIQIKKAGNADGGRSGEFFFFSSDNKLIIKTANSDEIAALLSNLDDFVYHFSKNPDSIIAKIYGAFEVEFANGGEKLRLIVMQNIGMGVPKTATIRNYDLKGSTVARLVIEDEKEKEALINDRSAVVRKILKDQDFMNLERRGLGLQLQDRHRLVTQLRTDAIFLGTHGLLDYSLLVQKYAISRMPVNIAGPSGFGAHTLRNLRTVDIEDGFGVNVGIIDYLGEYTMGKRFERYSKIMMSCNPNVNISALDPIRYCERFATFCQEKL